MGTTISMAKPIEAPLKGARRSRLSLHFNTPRVRRWLLVQLVSIPLDEIDEDESPELAYRAHTQVQPHKYDQLAQVVDNYRDGHLLHNML